MFVDSPEFKQMPLYRVSQEEQLTSCHSPYEVVGNRLGRCNERIEKLKKVRYVAWIDNDNGRIRLQGLGT